MITKKIKWNTIVLGLTGSALIIFAAAVLAAGDNTESLPDKIYRLTEQLQKDPLDMNVIFELHQCHQEHNRQVNMSWDVLLIGLKAYHQGDNHTALTWLQKAGRSPQTVELANKILAVPLESIIENARSSAGPSLCPKCGDTGRMDCPACNGLMMVRCIECKGTGETRKQPGQSLRVPCEQCNGWGRTKCATCRGGGTLSCQCYDNQHKNQYTNITLGSQLDMLAGAIGYLRAGGIDIYTQNGLEKAPK